MFGGLRLLPQRERLGKRERRSFPKQPQVTKERRITKGKVYIICTNIRSLKSGFLFLLYFLLPSFPLTFISSFLPSLHIVIAPSSYSRHSLIPPLQPSLIKLTIISFIPRSCCINVHRPFQLNPNIPRTIFFLFSQMP